MEQKHYKGVGLFGQEHGGETQPFVFPAEEVEKTLDDPRTMKLSNGLLIYFDPRAYVSRADVYDQCGGDNAKRVDAEAIERAWTQEGEACELGEKLFAGKWTDKQVKMYAAMLDEMSFFIKQFKYAL
ncbi:hypothetical protein, partial [Burkholderia sp. Bp8986]|uniref:hypothetical protein n=1 Tax=Burkholderia sp. Bp8986 TaxID=2184550 RepID=UPI000FBAEC1C